MASRGAGAADGVVADAVAAVARGKEQWDLRVTAVPAAPKAVAAANASTPSSRLAARCMAIVVGRRWPTGTIIRLRRVKVGMSIMTTKAEAIVAIAMSTK